MVAGDHGRDHDEPTASSWLTGRLAAVRDAPVSRKLLVTVVTAFVAWAVPYTAQNLLSAISHNPDMTASVDQVPRQIPRASPSERPSDQAAKPGGITQDGTAPATEGSSTIDYESSDDIFLGFVFPDSASELKPPTVEWRDLEYGDELQAFSDWAYENGGIVAGSQTIEIIVRGSSSTPVILRDLRIVATRSDPLEGTIVLDLGAGGLVHPRYAAIDLDASPPVIDKLSLNDDPQQTDGWDFPLSVSVDDPEVFMLDAFTERHYVEWRAQFFYEIGGRLEMLTIDDNGEPFRLSALPKRVDYSEILTYTPGVGLEPYE